MPVQLKVEVILPSPRNYPDNVMDKIDAAIEATLKGVVKQTLKSAFEKRTGNWGHRPEWVGRFAYEYMRYGHDPSMTVFPRGSARDIYTWVSRGTRGRVITAVNAPMLRYRHYTPRTTASNTYGGPGTYYGPIKKAKSVWNPGIEARHFEEHIIDEEGRGINAALQAAVLRASR